MLAARRKNTARSSPETSERHLSALENTSWRRFYKRHGEDLRIPAASVFMFVAQAGSSPLSKLKVYCVACFNGRFNSEQKQRGWEVSLIYNAEGDSASEMGNFTENGHEKNDTAVVVSFSTC